MHYLNEIRDSKAEIEREFMTTGGNLTAATSTSPAQYYPGVPLNAVNDNLRRKYVQPLIDMCKLNIKWEEELGGSNWRGVERRDAFTRLLINIALADDNRRLQELAGEFDQLTSGMDVDFDEVKPYFELNDSVSKIPSSSSDQPPRPSGKRRKRPRDP